MKVEHLTKQSESIEMPTMTGSGSGVGWLKLMGMEKKSNKYKKKQNAVHPDSNGSVFLSWRLASATCDGGCKHS